MADIDSYKLLQGVAVERMASADSVAGRSSAVARRMAWLAIESMIYARPGLSQQMVDAVAPPASFLLLAFLSSRAFTHLASTSFHFPPIVPPFSQQLVPRWPLGLGQIG